MQVAASVTPKLKTKNKFKKAWNGHKLVADSENRECPGEQIRVMITAVAEVNARQHPKKKLSNFNPFIFCHLMQTFVET